MEFLQVISKDNLPTKYRNVITTEGNDYYEIRSNVKTADDIISWCCSFEKNTDSVWILNHTSPNGERMVCKREYACQHSKKNKTPILQDVTNKRGVSRNCNCEAKIIFKIKPTTKNTKKRDSYVRDGMPCVIKIFTKHSHPLASYEVLKYLPTDGDVRHKFFDYFEAGMGAKESIKHHLDLLDMMDSSEEDFSNARINPTYRTVSYWFEMYRNGLM